MAVDAYTFGQIVAANSLSDVYAMGGTPIVALCIATFPAGEIEHGQIRAMLRGVWDKVREAGAVIAGGHTSINPEVTCGLAVTGLVHPGRMTTNAGARPGDILILTKPLGSGIITTALCANLAPASSVAEANRLMSTLNRSAAEAMAAVGVNAATDITGFGLLGHAWEMAQASQVDFAVDSNAVPMIAGAQELARQSLFQCASVKNHEFMKGKASFATAVAENQQMLLCDAQTSGGLLMSVPAAKTSVLLKRLHSTGVVEAAIIGEVRAGTGHLHVG
jgi:selenide,water dikinase